MGTVQPCSCWCPQRNGSCFGNEHPWAILPVSACQRAVPSLRTSITSSTQNVHAFQNDHLWIPLDSAQKISKINNHPKGLSLLGILPNQLRGLLKSGGQDADIAFDDISMELFRHGYRIWIQRKRLNKNFWKNIAPNEWKKSYKEPGRTKRKINVAIRSTFLQT